MLKKILEDREQQFLSLFAAKSAASKGREKEINPCDNRTEFQRDRDRILHSKSFRRLQFKTQVFIAPEGDHYRTRLTHTLEVSQVARSIAQGLNLNQDLTEAIALGHDLGHTPFGHIGERTLDRLSQSGFWHSKQSVRVVEILENNGAGLNLTWEVRNGILNHSGKGRADTLEGRIVAKADRIAYINHDIDDALRAGILREKDLPEACLNVLGQSHGERINNMILDTITNSYEKNEIIMSDRIQGAMDELRQFMFERVYTDPWRSGEEEKCDFVVEKLFDHYLKHPSEMPYEYITVAYKEGTERAVLDFVASMTDRYALRQFHSIYVPKAFNVV